MEAYIGTHLLYWRRRTKFLNQLHLKSGSSSVVPVANYISERNCLPRKLTPSAYSAFNRSKIISERHSILKDKRDKYIYFNQNDRSTEW